MDALNSLLFGFNNAIQPVNLFCCFIGVFLGTLVGVLPGIGPTGGIAMLLPLSYGLSPTAAIVLLAGLYYGAQYGGSITSILVNVPGEASTVVTCLDGHQMALKGRAGPALGIAAFGSFIAGTIGVMGLMLIANPLSKIALKFGPPEFFALMIVGIIILVSISQKSVIKGLLMAAVGFTLSYVGIDPIAGRERFTFDTLYLTSGIDIGPVAIGLFGVSEVLISMEESSEFKIIKAKLKTYFPTLQDWGDSICPILRGTIIGFFIGTIPGGGVILSSFASYGIEKRVSKHPDKFGTGIIEGVAGPESANNAGAQGAFVPLLVLGIPSNAIMALLLGALLIHGIQPGPLFLSEHGDIFWGFVASMYIGNVFLLILNLPLIPLWVQLLKVPKKILLPLILLFCILGTYGINNNILDVFVMIICGLVAYVLRKLEYEMAPLCLALVLGSVMETNFRQSLIISGGSFTIFVTRPIPLVMLSVAVFLLALSVFRGRSSLVSR